MYDFETELQALRLQIGQEMHYAKRYIKPNYVTIRPLVILMNEGLIDLGYNQTAYRDQIRYRILSLWVEDKIRSTYDLSVYQCSTIISFLTDGQWFGLTERAKSFLGDSAERAKARHFDRAKTDHQKPKAEDIQVQQPL